MDSTIRMAPMGTATATATVTLEDEFFDTLQLDPVQSVLLCRIVSDMRDLPGITSFFWQE